MRSGAKYIVLEGVQGSGKSSQTKRLADWLQTQGIPVHLTREPGGADVVARSLRILTQDPRLYMNTKTEVLLYNAARAQSLDIVRSLLSRGVWVVSDRNFLTTLAIQYYARQDGLAYEDVKTICEFAVGDMMPDVTFVLDIDAEAAKKRLAMRYQGDKFDRLSVDFMDRARQGLLKEAAARSYSVVNASKSEDEVFKQLVKAVKPLLRLVDTSIMSD